MIRHWKRSFAKLLARFRAPPSRNQGAAKMPRIAEVVANVGRDRAAN